jgi:DNA-directed RNA polymerase specialized sigma24 family protein
MTKLSTFVGKSSFRTWLYRIVVNHVLTRSFTEIIRFKNRRTS